MPKDAVAVFSASISSSIFESVRSYEGERGAGDDTASMGVFAPSLRDSSCVAGSLSSDATLLPRTPGSSSRVTAEIQTTDKSDIYVGVCLYGVSYVYRNYCSVQICSGCMHFVCIILMQS